MIREAVVLGPNDKVILTMPDDTSMTKMNDQREKIKRFLEKEGRGFILVREGDLVIVKDGVEITLKSLEE